MIRLESKANGTIIPVRAQPGARRPGITGEYDGALRIAVSAAPEKGKANQAIIKLLANTFDIPKSSVLLAHGTASRQKRFLLLGQSAESIFVALQELLGDATL